MEYTTIDELCKQWPERAMIRVRLHLYDNGTWSHTRCNLVALSRVFGIAEELGIQTSISTNLNRINAVYVEVDNYVLLHRTSEFASKKGNWGDHYGFLLRLAAAFPAEVFLDDPRDAINQRYQIDRLGRITKTIECWDDFS